MFSHYRVECTLENNEEQNDGSVSYRNGLSDNGWRKRLIDDVLWIEVQGLVCIPILILAFCMLAHSYHYSHWLLQRAAHRHNNEMVQTCFTVFESISHLLSIIFSLKVSLSTYWGHHQISKESRKDEQYGSAVFVEKVGKMHLVECLRVLQKKPQVTQKGLLSEHGTYRGACQRSGGGSAREILWNFERTVSIATAWVE